MKRSGIINAALAGAIARLGHTDELLICDSGMPLPRDVQVVDLAFLPGILSFADVLNGILDEIVVEGATAAEEIHIANPACAALLGERLRDVTYVPHEELKHRTYAARLIVRTGEAHPYANVILRCGVTF